MDRMSYSTLFHFCVLSHGSITCHDIIPGFLRFPSPSYVGFVAIGGVYWNKSHMVDEGRDQFKNDEREAVDAVDK